MNRSIIIFSVFLSTLLLSCDKGHYYVKIINNSDLTIVVTTSRAGHTIIGSLEPDVSFSYRLENGDHPIDPYSEMVLDLSPYYFEQYNGRIDKKRFYFIENEVFEAAERKPGNLDPDDYLGYIDLSGSEAREVNWTIRFPEDTINNM